MTDRKRYGRPLHIAHKNAQPFETVCGKDLRRTKWVAYENRDQATCGACRQICVLPADNSVTEQQIR